MEIHLEVKIIDSFGHKEEGESLEHLNVKISEVEVADPVKSSHQNEEEVKYSVGGEVWA